MRWLSNRFLKEYCHGFTSHVQRIHLNRLELRPQRRDGAGVAARHRAAVTAVHSQVPAERVQHVGHEADRARDGHEQAVEQHDWRRRSNRIQHRQQRRPDFGGPSASVGIYDVVVSQLARAQVTASTSLHPDADTTAVAAGGSLVINGKTVTVTVPTTLQKLADAINATEDIGVTATVVSPTPGQYQLVLTSHSTGAANGFTIQNNLTGGASAVTFADTDGDGLSGNSAADNKVSATDAIATDQQRAGVEPDEHDRFGDLRRVDHAPEEGSGDDRDAQRDRGPERGQTADQGLRQRFQRSALVCVRPVHPRR